MLIGKRRVTKRHERAFAQDCAMNGVISALFHSARAVHSDEIADLAKYLAQAVEDVANGKRLTGDLTLIIEDAIGALIVTGKQRSDYTLVDAAVSLAHATGLMGCKLQSPDHAIARWEEKLAEPTLQLVA